MRLVDRIVGARPGPTLILVAGMHGNEPAGLGACASLFSRVRGAAISGELVALRGNVRALELGRRFVDQDLNRMWTRERLAHSRGLDLPTEEAKEQLELFAALEEIRRRARGPVILLDLHTTSARGVPFLIVSPTAADRAFAAKFPLPGVVGLEAMIEGVLTSFMSGLGCVAIAVEGGQTGSPEAELNLDAAITVALDASGVLPSPPGLEAARARLSAEKGALPQLIEVASRHALAPGHEFRMEPGFANIHPTPRGALLARDRGEEIRASFDGVVLLPLYQPEGSDGFFYGRALG